MEGETFEKDSCPLPNYLQGQAPHADMTERKCGGSFKWEDTPSLFSKKALHKPERLLTYNRAFGLETNPATI